MKNIFGSLLLFLFIFALTGAKCFAVEEKTVLRVGISNSSFSSYIHTKAGFISKGNMNIVDMESGNKKEVEPDNEIEIKIKDGLFYVNTAEKEDTEGVKGPVVITSSDTIGIKDIKRKGSPAYYRGMIELKAQGAGFNIINVLDMQSYLKGVVPNEMPVSFGFEALKAQSVAARNYANRPLNNYSNYDVCDSTACQVYYGANSETEISDRAVDETLGIYALYNNEIILTLYSSTPGGVTENYLDTFGNFIEDKPYLKSVSDTENLNKIKLEDYFKNPYPSFDMKSPRYRWEKTFTREELEEILSKTLVEQSKAGNVEPYFTGELTGLNDIKVLKRGESNKVLELEIKSKSGDFIVKKELPIRRIFKSNTGILASANFIVEKEFEKAKKEKIKEEIKEEKAEEEAIFQSEEIKKSPDIKLLPEIKERKRLTGKLPSKFTFYGAGFGHGVGMSQYGAGFLSSFGVNYENILKHYYTGINLGTIPKTVSYNNLGIDYIQEFYFSRKNNSKGKFENPSKSPLKKEINALLEKNKNQRCYLTIENPDKVSEVEFFINGYYFSPEIKNFRKKALKTEITNYLEEGKNKITFKPLNEKDRKKQVRFYITTGDKNEQ